MNVIRWRLVVGIGVLAAAVACEPERRKPTEEPAAGEGEGEPAPGDEDGDEQGDGGEGEAPDPRGEGEGEPAPDPDGGEGEGEGPDAGGGEGEGENPFGDFCRENADCPDDAYCDRGNGECIVAEGCDPCDPTDFCAPDGAQPRRCDFRFGAAGCCIGSCISDDDCPDEQYCDFGGPSCEDGCRVGECGEGLICGLQDRVCREGCLAHEDCPGEGRICDLDNQVCVDGCLAEGGCPEGERCDVELRQCTTGCVGDEECGEGRRCHRADHRCVQACERDGDCLEGQLCDEEVGGCVANPGGCVAGGCPDEAACDPMRGICGEAAELDCEPGGECAPVEAAEGEGEGEGDVDVDAVCVPEGAEERFACAPRAGEGGAGAACETGADCVSGICLNEGACYAGCGEHADCPEGMRCWSARFLTGLAEELMDPSGDTVREAPACLTPPTPCLTPEDCEDADEECLPWWDPDAEAMAAACRPAAGGELAPGERCHTDDDCRTGLCTDDHICLEICDGDDSCADGQICGALVVQADGREGEIPVCTLDPGSGQECTKDADCPEGEACHPEAAIGEDDAEIVALRCRPGQGLGPAELCDDPWDCRSGHCVNGVYCFAGCSEDADCPEGVPCQEQPSGVRDREDVLVSMCLEPNLPCVRDADCPLEGQACSPEEDPDDPEVLAPLCREALGDGRGGEECNRDRDCLSGYCIQDLPIEVCWEGCTTDDDCADGMRCYDDVAPVPVDDGDAFESMPACLPDRGSLEDCDRNADCETPREVCAIIVSGDRRDLNGRCVTQRSDPEQDAEVCQDPDQCSTGMCGPQSNPIFPGPCLVLCEGDEDCPQQWFFGLGGTCQRADVELQGVDDRIEYCAPPI